MTPVAPEAVPVPFAGALEVFGDRPALVTAGGAVSYRELARRADEIGERLGNGRRLVLVATRQDVDTVASYLAALRLGHPVLLVPPDSGTVTAMTEAYDPDVVLAGGRLVERHPTSAHDLHPDLALLLSTSGSTGSPKLVRLSRDNVQSNAEAIATYLDIRPDDRAGLALPLHYCYGLSVLHSHLLRGAAVILSCLSVADREFWDLFRRERGTTFPAVPYTFDLLDRIGFADLDLPDLRYVTQAGGRLDPDRVRHYARLGRTRGWDLFVMYGQTEATARMAYLPPHRAETAPDAIGVPIPGGALRTTADGELVYSGPNVMLGYAERPADLSRGRDVHELFTGDLAHQGDDGLYRIVGRRSRFLKLFGHRIDLQRIEAGLAAEGVTAACAGDDRTLVVAVESTRPDVVAVCRLVGDATGLPPSAIAVHVVPEIPRLASGKPDYPAIAALAVPALPGGGSGDRVAELVARYAAVLDRAGVTPAHSFVDLGGDSLSYVEVSIHIEQIVGTLPPDWPATSIADLATAGSSVPPSPSERPSRRRVRTLDTSVLLRAVAIVLVVGTHVQVFGIPGGAHMLLGVAGFNFARFRLTAAGRTDRIRGMLRSVGRIVAVAVPWIAVVMLTTDQYTPANLFLLNNVVGSVEDRNTWHFWFIEDLIYLILAAVLLLSLVDRWERRWPLAPPVAMMAVGLVAHYQLVPGVELHKTVANAFLFAIGWAAAKLTGRGQRLWLTTLALATIPGYFGDPTREVVMLAGLALLIWVPVVPATRLVITVAAGLASASLYIYLVHWQVYEHLSDVSRPLAAVASIAAGLAYAVLFTRLAKRTGRLRARFARPRRGRREPTAVTT
jgi:acyl-CoA synthetase (AMP-forming)/AMP-acid ligase II/acyl carrier protein